MAPVVAAAVRHAAGDVKRDMRVNWLTYTDERDYDRVESALWIRGLQLLPYLEALGVRNAWNQPDRPADVAVFLRWQNAEAQALAAELRRRGQKVVFDLCVNYFDACEGPAGACARPAQVAEARAMLELADVVTCASRFIADRAGAHHPRAVYVPDSIDGRHFGLVKDPADFARSRLRAIWSGVSVKSADLAPLLPLLARERFDLAIVSDRDPFPRGSWRWLWAKARLGYRFVPWHYRTFPAAILGGELCVGPRDRGVSYNCGHSFFKIGVFLAEGVPALAARVPSYGEVLLDGRNGRFADTPREWREALRAARGARSSLVDWSRAARTALAPFDTARVAEAYRALFETLRR